jgi:DNA primase
MRLSKSQKELLEKATESYAQNLQEIVPYLQSRGLTEQTAVMFRLGFVREPEMGHEPYVGKLAIPYLTPTGVIDIRFRSLNSDGGPKYMSRPGATTHIYNIGALANDSDVLAICEGELDTIVASAILGIPAVGVPGVQAWKPHFTRMFSGYGRVYIVGDNDVKEDGSNPGAEFSRMVAQEVSNSTIVSLPAGMDLNDLYLAKGIEETKRTIGVPNV